VGREREIESEREMKFDVGDTYFSKLENGDITNKKIKYYILNEWFRAVMWQCMRKQVNNLLLLNKH